MSDMDDLQRLAEMRDAGEITSEEYETVRAEILSEMRPAPEQPDRHLPPTIPPLTEPPIPPRQPSRSKRQMRTGSTYDRLFQGSMRRVFLAATRAAAELGHTVLASTPETGTLTFNSGRSMRTWAGQDMTATVIDLGNGSCKVSLGGATSMKGNPFGGGGGQLFAWGEKGIVADAFLAKVEQLLPSVAEPPESAASGSSGGGEDLAGQLAQLAKLFDDGALSADQFEAAKSKLLG